MFKFAQKNVVINSLKKLESNSKSALVLNCQSKNKCNFLKMQKNPAILILNTIILNTQPQMQTQNIKSH